MEIQVLLAGDEKKELLRIKKLLSTIKKSRFRVHVVLNPDNALAETLGGHVDVCLVDFVTEPLDGFNLVRKAIGKGSEVPFVVLASEEDSTEASDAGASDCLNKQELNGQLLDRVIRYTIERKKSEDQLTKVNQQLQYLANYDLLTGLANRNQFNNQLPFIIERCMRQKLSLAVLFLDLDEFKQINDAWGHSYGDLLLRQVAKRLRKNLRKVDNIYRLGGDEFIVVVDGHINEDQVSHLADKIIAILSEPFILNEYKCQMSTSIGISFANFDSMRPSEQLSKEADIAMYNAKKNGRNTYQFYRAEYVDDVLRYTHLTLDLYEALSNNQFRLQYQPLISLDGDVMMGVEALLRWYHPQWGNIPPKVFIPLAEKNGLINPIGEWVMREACMQSRQWQEEGYAPLHMAINIAISQLQHPHFVDTMKNIIQETQVDPSRLELEISESSITTNFHECAQKMSELKEIGVHFVIDDFGTGYSNLGYLKHFPFDKLKIDKLFIDEITSNNNEQYIVEAIINLAKQMNLEVLAEGVETREQLNYLRKHHSDQVQGFYYSEPLDVDVCTRLLAKGNKWNPLIKKNSHKVYNKLR
ncbi:GGDEF domain-containing response regulator [Legionella taurinensis]|uniref:GGDEF domain-containing response regulator n=1 Tax=Legionella taurinensis TaxID=70611 RepID=A0A3A5LDE4_9GAMM|nr:GGDEF domain-containing response regulator [Legionella taurinensis]MDX1837920.1 GGDEF domain-containing response regulator [Legionella taurinensis]PUT39579.1 hypothetical protein DB744_08565 [Legionella taurinensis]PUT43274.1 hypothetical protein DB746_05890 [Legionella taurinensis]PUT45719.1 hypothetical protein DB743_05885 [Legionella taurinensis]PUT47632.1 hypothetical protein DB745_06970 [Legionella taurinensis]